MPQCGQASNCEKTMGSLPIRSTATVPFDESLSASLKRVHEPALDGRAVYQPVDNDLDAVFLVFVKRYRFVKGVDAVVHPHAHEPVLLQFFEQVLVFALAA